MTINNLSFAAAIILLLPLLYFLVASPSFFFRPFSDPIVTWMFRGLFNIYFLVVTGSFTAAALVFLLASRWPVALGMAAVAVLAVAARYWFLRRIDAALRARDAGDAAALRHLRRLHLGGMAYNAAQVLLVLAGIARTFPNGA